MKLDDVVGLVVAVLLGAYLVVALLYPERLG
ncbi:MAG TPA: K(+)-transporting ATPase subunit F [Acidimicrobiia bacterium]|nr:K(+)-transporting ATPase subunit F [Acidimicrobiia bacterium]